MPSGKGFVFKGKGVARWSRGVVLLSVLGEKKKVTVAALFGGFS